MRDPAPPLRTLVSGVPAPLAELVDGLLQAQPEARPSLERCAELVAAAGGRRAELARPRAGGALVGRDGELSSALAACRAALGRGGAVVLAGSSGAGKTVLAEAVAAALREEGALVLRGRGRADDRLAFNAVDGAVDQLAIDLAAEATVDERTRELAALAASAFPVLLTHASGGGARNRLEAFEAVARLVAHRAGPTGAVLLVDDLQWADTDSLRLLHELCGAGVVVLATLRDDGAAPAADGWASAIDAHVVRLRSLDRPSLVAIIRRGAGAEVADEVLERALALCDGRPYFAELAGMALARGERGHPLDALVTDALVEGGDCVAALLAADDWVRVGVLATHLGTTPGHADDAVAVLAARGVVRRAGATGPDQRVDIFHDALRAALGAAMDPAVLAAAHGRFADLALGGELPGESRARTARHLLAAERRHEAAREARGAADEAEEQLAFGLAADMLGLALEHGPAPGPELLRRRAELLERVARYREAAACWDEVARASESFDRTEATIRSAFCLLGANRMTEGAARLDDALVASGDRPLGRRGLAELWAAARFVLGRSAPREAGPDPEATRRAEAELRLGTLLGYFDPIQGIRVLLRARDTFARVGAHAQVARCEMLFAVFADFGHAGPSPSPLSKRYAASAERRIAEHGLDGPRFEAYRRFLDGMLCLRQARWDEADAHVRETVASMESIGERGSFEHTYGLAVVGLVAYVREDFAGLEQMVRRFREVQRDGGDLTLETHARLHTIALGIVRGEWEVAEREIAEALASLPSMPSIQRPVLLTASALLPLHTGDVAGALDRVLEAEPYARHFRLHRTNVPNHAAVAGLVEVRALQAGDSRASRRRIRRRLRRLDRGGPTVAGVASRMRSYLASHRGRTDEAVAWLERAEVEAREADRPVSEAIALYQRGLHVGGDDGLAMRTRARRRLLGLGLTPVLLEDGRPSE